MEFHHHPIRTQYESTAADMAPTLMMTMSQFSPAFTGSPISTSESEFLTPDSPLPSTAIPMSSLPSVPAGTAAGRGCDDWSRKSTATMDAMRDIIYRIAAMQPILPIDLEDVRPPKRRNMKISKDPQSVAARQRRERISQRIRILQRLVPGGTKMDTASMLDEAVHYVKFLKKEVQSLEQAALFNTTTAGMVAPMSSGTGGDGSGCGSYQPLPRMMMQQQPQPPPPPPV